MPKKKFCILAFSLAYRNSSCRRKLLFHLTKKGKESKMNADKYAKKRKHCNYHRIKKPHADRHIRVRIYFPHFPFLLSHKIFSHIYCARDKDDKTLYDILHILVDGEEGEPDKDNTQKNNAHYNSAYLSDTADE